jgi:gliding motility-associated-like protein
MEYKYKSKIMNNNLFENTNLIRLVLFMFLGVWSISVNAQCTPNIASTYENCTGDSVMITAAPGYTYSWSTGETTQSIWVTSSSSVWVVIEDLPNNCFDSSSFNAPTVVTILDPTITPSNTTICFGDSITLCTDTIITNSTYIWSTGDTTGCVNVSPNQTTTYWVTQNENGVSCSDSVDITVRPEINISATVNDNSSQNACDGQIFSSATGGSGGLSYAWDTSGVAYPGGQNLFNLCENTYCLTVTDIQGCAEDSCFNVEWNPCNLDVSIIDPIDCNGGLGAFEIIVDTLSGTGPLTFFGLRFEYTIYTTNPLTQISQQPLSLPTWTTLSNYPAGDYLISVYDQSWGDSCYTNITLIEPDPILIYTTVVNASASWINDGSILIDSITGGVGNNTWVWYDSSYVQSPPGTPILFDSLLLDSIYYSHEYYGGYTISVTDSNGCPSDTTLYVYPDLTVTSFDTAYVSQNEICWGYDDGKIFGVMNDSAVPPFTYYWIDVDGSMPGLNPGDTMRVDCFGCPPPSNYNPSHVATHTNLAPGCYLLSATDAFGNESVDILPLCINAADSMYVVIEPDVDSITLNCSENILLRAAANPLPAVAQLMPDTQLVSDVSGNNSFQLQFGGAVSGATYSLYDSPQRTYYLQCSGVLTDNSIPPLNYDAAFMDWPGNPTAQNSIWAWNISNGGTVPLLNSSVYDGVTHTYTWTFSANSNLASTNGFNPNFYDHEFIVNSSTINGNLTCQVFGVVDTIIYDYVWTTVANPGTVLSTADTLLTDSSIVVTTDYVVTVTNTNGCEATDIIRVNKDLNTLALDSVLITPVRPCYGDLTGEIHIDVVDSSGVQPFTYVLYDVDTNFIQSTSDTFFTGLASGNYVIQVQDTIGCLNPFATCSISQPDTIFACGVDVLNDTTFDVFTHTVIANDPSTWNFQFGTLAPNFQYYLEIDGTFTLHSVQSSPPYNQDAAFDGLILNNIGNQILNPIPGPYWVVNGDVLRPDTDVISVTNTYIYNNPSDVNGLGAFPDYFTGSGNILNVQFFGLNNPTANTIHNQGGLNFRLHKIACTQTDTAFTCKGEGLGFAFVRPQSVNGNLGGIPYAGPDGIVFDSPGPDGILGTLDDLPTGDDDYYETAWIKYNPVTGANIDTIQGGPGAGASDTIVNLFVGSYRVVVIDSLGCSEFVRYLEVLEPIDTFRTELDTVMPVLCKYDSTGVIQVSNFGGFDSVATNGSVIVPIASTASRYAVLIKDDKTTLISGSPIQWCENINALPQANYVDTIVTYVGVLDSIIFDNLNAGRYQVHVYDSIPDATYGQYNPLTGEVLNTPFNYMPCPQIIDAYIKEPCSPLASSTTLLADVICWGDSTGPYCGRAFVQASGGANETNGFYSYQWHNAPFGINGLGEMNDTAYNLWADTVINLFPNALWHTVTVTDTSGCSIEDSILIKHTYKKIRPFYVENVMPFDTIWDIQFIEDSVSCFTVCDGEVALQSLGGVYPHEYVWDTDPFTTVYNQPDTMSDLCEGGHDVLITDGIGCPERVRFRIYEPDQIFAIGTLVDPISCFGFDDGTAHVVGIGGNNLSGSQNSYTFNWYIDSIAYNVDSLIGQGQNLVSIPPGVHVVSVTDYKGCTNTDTIEFIEPTKLSVIIVDSLTQYAYCEYTESAKLCAQAFGGTPNYVYQWDDAYGQTNLSALPFGTPFCASNLTPINTNSIDGTYKVGVWDDRGCFADTTIDIDTITNTFNVNSIITTTTHVSCFGGYDGAIDIIEFKIIDSTVFNNITLVVDTFYHIITLPNPAYSFTWTGPNGYSQNTQNISALYAGSYAVIIEDNMGCKRTKNIEVTEPAQLYYNIYTTVDATCVGDGYTNTPTTPPSEGSCDGQIMINVTGGTWPYYYDALQANVWPIAAANQLQLINNTLIDNLCFGIHEIYLTDAEGCEGQVVPGGIGVTNIGEGIVVTVPGVVTPTDPTTCSDTDDGFAIFQSPADPLFNYTWETNNPGPPPGPSGIIVSTTAPSFDGFAQGDYWVIAHYADAANFGQNYPGCDAEQSFTIGGPGAIIPGQSFIEPECWGENNGSITLIPSGGTPGTPPYTYLWDITTSIPANYTSNTSTVLLAGTYGITITDGNGCDTTIIVEVTQPDQLQNDFTITDVSCNNGNDGVIVATPNGGTGVADYNNWIQGNPTLTLPGPPTWKWDAAQGIYIVKITDANGCWIYDTAIVGEPNPLVITDFVVIEPLCYGGADGQVTAVVEGGTGSGTYSYNWSNGQTSNPAINISSGSLTLDITDANGCPATYTEFIAEPTEINDNATLSTNNYGFEVSCYGENDGWISLNPTGGVPFSNGAYTYQWDPSSISIDSVASNLSGDRNYSVNITDANNCTYTFNYYLDAPDDPFYATVSTVNYFGPANPPFSVLFVDSTAFNMGTSVQESWTWINGEVMPGTAINSGEIGEFTFPYTFEEIGLNNVYVIVTNTSTGCEDTVSFTIAVQGIPDINNVFSPNGDGTNDEFMFDEFGVDVISVEIYNRWGQLVNNWTDINKGWDGRGPDGQELPEGVYFYVLTADGEDSHYYSKKGTITLIR